MDHVKGNLQGFLLVVMPCSVNPFCFSHDQTVRGRQLSTRGHLVKVVNRGQIPPYRGMLVVVHETPTRHELERFFQDQVLVR